MAVGQIFSYRTGSLAHTFRSAAFQALLLTVIVYLFVFQYCRIRFWRDPHSAFFDITRVYDWQYSLTREHEAHHFISFHKAQAKPMDNDGNTQQRQESENMLKSSDQPLLCAAFVTVKREVDDYFEDSIGSMLEGLDPRERRALHLKVVFANTNPQRHPSWGQPWLNQVIDSVESVDVPQSTFRKLQQLEAEEDFQTEGVFDYVYTLNRCLETGAPFIGIFEDDILFADGWMAKTLRGLMKLSPTINSDPNPSSLDPPSTSTKVSWLYMRLFYTETHFHWDESYFAYRHIPMIFVGATSTGLLVCTMLRKVFPQTQSTLTYGTIIVLCLITIPAFTGLYYMIGEYSVHPLPSDVVPMDSGCCSQALVFPREQVPSLIEYLEGEASGQTDLMIEEYATKTGLRRFALAPPQLQHVGLHSSRKMAEIDTQSVWAFWFEANDAKQLRKEHAEILNDEKIDAVLSRFRAYPVPTTYR